MESHGEFLREIIKDDALVEQLKSDYRIAPLGELERCALAYAEKLTLRPSEMSRQDIETLRGCRFSDEQILDIVLITGYFSYLNRLADALGVELDAQFNRRS